MIVLDPNKYNIHPIKDCLYYDIISLCGYRFRENLEKDYVNKTISLIRDKVIYLNVLSYSQRGTSVPELDCHLYLFNTEENKILFKLKYGL